MSMNYSKLNEQQKHRLLEMLGRALVNIRQIGRQGLAEQAASLANAFHTLPYELSNETPNLKQFRIHIEDYNAFYPPQKVGDYFDFLTLLNQIENNQ